MAVTIVVGVMTVIAQPVCPLPQLTRLLTTKLQSVDCGNEVSPLLSTEFVTVRALYPSLVAIVITAAFCPLMLCRETVAEETVTITEQPGFSSGYSATPSGCGCRNVQQPPWHGNLHTNTCGPACGPCLGTFHADPCHQLHPRRHLQSGCVKMPSCFPRLHGWCAEGIMPTPVSPRTPRCHQCGAMIDGGF